MEVAVLKRGMESKFSQALSGTDSHRENPALIRLIAGFKIVGGVLLLAVAIGVLRLLNPNVALQVKLWMAELYVDPQNHFIHRLLFKLTRLSDNKLQAISAGSFLYAGLLLAEGTGLLLRKKWAEYLTVIGTGLFIPLEIYELVKAVSAGKAALLIINVMIVWYLIKRIKTSKAATPRNKSKRDNSYQPVVISPPQEDS